MLKPAEYEVPLRSDHPLCMNFLRTSLHKCLWEHGGQLEADPELPHRVLEVITPEDIRLVVADGERAQYIALSYRRGSTEMMGPVRTTKGNLEQRMNKVPSEVLTQVFKDVISIATLLGIRYLWIDALCITQDDPEDWAVESANMCTIYGNSTLTVFAVHESGCFQDRENVFRHSMRYFKADGVSFDVFAQVPLDHTGWLRLPRHDHGSRGYTQQSLFDRGWVFQEWMLSSRGIVFDRDELLWVCDHVVSCECMHGSHAVGNTHPEGLISSRFSFRGSTSQYGPKDPALRNWHWRSTAEAYKNKDLTLQGDTLPALSGLAKRFGAGSTSRYLAGCWEDDLVPSLLWHSDMPTLFKMHEWFGNRKSDDRQELQAVSYIGPTWSWMSSQGSVSFEDLFHNTSGGQRVQLYEVEKAAALTHTLIRQPHRLLCDVESVECIPSTTDPTGRLQSGRLTISGPSVDAQLSEAPHDGITGKALVFEGMRYRVIVDLASPAYLRLEAGGSSAVPVTCLVLCIKLELYDWVGYTELGLVLTPSEDHPGSYERIGMLAHIHQLLYSFKPRQEPGIGRHYPGDKDRMRSYADLWRTYFGTEVPLAREDVDFDDFYVRLMRPDTPVPKYQEALIRRTTRRRLTIV